MKIIYGGGYIICKLLGHKPIDVDTQKLTAACGRCGVKLDVSYDMANGQTLCQEVL